MKQEEFSVRARLKSFRFAWQGMKSFLLGEHNARLHLVATAGVILVAILFPVTQTEWLALVFAMGFVWVAEMLNTCIERIMDFVSDQQHPEIKFIKDLAAGAVLVAAITAVIVAAIVFIPKLIGS